jgi:hypothetical protein
MDEDVNAKLTAAWRAAIARLIEAGYEPVDVYATMIKVGLSFAKDQTNDNPEPSAQVGPRTERLRVPVASGRGRQLGMPVIGFVVTRRSRLSVALSMARR